ncbi:MAG: hypothetical protein CM15mP74_26200 [Halieaceae bacterium]|nr:MAG: hypothetical protein CM15mP74_26200 [Halieaceae bacterium]
MPVPLYDITRNYHVHKNSRSRIGAAVLPAALLCAFASSSHAGEWSANASMTSNYIWRGLTQTENEAAVQGGIDYAADNGFTSAPGRQMLTTGLATFTSTSTMFTQVSPLILATSAGTSAICTTITIRRLNSTLAKSTLASALEIFRRNGMCWRTLKRTKLKVKISGSVRPTTSPRLRLRA